MVFVSFYDVKKLVSPAVKSLRTPKSLPAAVEKAADAIEKLIEVIQNHDFLESLIKPRWIPVAKAPSLKVGDEGYPGYLVVDANGYYDVADYTVDRLGNGPSFHVDGEYEPDITHYMPLPEPPKENGKSET